MGSLGLMTGIRFQYSLLGPQDWVAEISVKKFRQDTCKGIEDRQSLVQNEPHSQGVRMDNH